MSTVAIKSTAKTKPHIRWMIRKDLPEILAIEREGFEFPWREEDFIRCLRQRNCIGMVADIDGKVAGFMVYELRSDRINLLNFAVAASVRRRGIGAAMVDKLKGKLSEQRRSRLRLFIAETNLDGQLFFRAMGFRAIGIEKEWCDDGQDGYLLQFRHKDSL